MKIKEYFEYDPSNGKYVRVVHKAGENTTDIQPPKEFEKRSGVSPIFDEESETWSEDKEALGEFHKNNTKPIELDTTDVLLLKVMDLEMQLSSLKGGTE